MTPENILFFIAYGSLIIIILMVFFFIIKSVLFFIFRLLRKIFGIEKPEKDIAKNTKESFQVGQIEQKNPVAARPTLQYGANIPEKEPEKAAGQGAVQGRREWEEKAQKNIQAELEKLKLNNEINKEIEKSFYSSQKPGQHDPLAKIEIPRPKKFGSSKENQPGIGQPAPVYPLALAANEKNGENRIVEENKRVEFFLPKSSKISAEQKTGNRDDTSIFAGKEELTRPQLKYKLRTDKNVWKAGVQTGFKLSRTERENLEKDLFPKIYGRNISKQDFQRRIKMMIREKGVNTSNAGKREQLRKEINFLKKIGGSK